MNKADHTFSADALFNLARRALETNGAPSAVATAVGQVLIEADKRGVASHGVARLPNYIARMRQGLIDAHAQPELVHTQGGLSILDGRNGFGAHAGLEATRLAAEGVEAHGVTWVSVRNSNHFGLAAAYTRRLAQQGLAAICLSNAPPAAAAYGGKRAVLGTNPISMAVPGDEAPVLLDMATTIVARGKIREAARRKEPIAEGLALDGQGRSTTDPHEALQGTLTPIGGPKGYGLALLIDLFTGFFAGGHCANDIGESSDFSRPSRTCFTLIAAGTAHLGPDRGKAYMQQVAAMIRASADTPSSVRLPGEIEDEQTERAVRDGIRITPKLAEELEALASNSSD